MILAQADCRIKYSSFKLKICYNKLFLVFIVFIFVENKNTVMSIKQLHLSNDINQELKLIAAEVNGKSKTSFLEDFFIHAIASYKTGALIPTFPLFETDLSDNGERISINIDEDTAYYLRLIAVKMGTNIKVYMQSFCTWLANEHRANGRVWIDDTPVKALPIRTRK